MQQLTIEEKLRLICGKDAWSTCDFNGKLPFVKVTDASMGVRMGKEDGNGDKPSISYPSSQLLANTWDLETVRAYAECVADDCLDYGADILLGPGVNIKRNPLCGRNFEYYSEDPYLAGVIAREYVSAMQAEGAGACVKHFCCNNIEYNRRLQSSEVDERTLREIYYKPFEIACEAKPVSVMCSYNKINGVQGSEYKKGFTVLREEYGFDGAIISDWDAVYDRAKAAKAGLDLEMPFLQSHYDKLLEDYKAGKITEEEIDACAARVLELVYRCEEMRKTRKVKRSKQERLAVAREIAQEGMVLLKNDGVLPLCKGTKLSVCGEFAAPGRCSLVAGGGSAMVPWQGELFNPPKLLGERLGVEVKFDAAFWPKGIGSNWQKAHKALLYAEESDVAIVCAGTGADIECEGNDRDSMRLPAVQENMILETARRCSKTVVVLFAGSALDMSAWKDKVSAILWAGFCGEGGGEALADLLTGAANPSGKLSESFLLCLEDSTSYGTYNDPCVARYQEGLDVGYRGYDRQGKEVAFPFGFGLSYSSFEYEGLELSVGEKGLTVRFTLKNVSDRDGKEISQIYVRPAVCFVYRPEKELKGYTKTFVAAGKTAVAETTLEADAFAYYSTAQDRWKTEDGIYEILVGASSRDIRLRAKIAVKDGKIVL